MVSLLPVRAGCSLVLLVRLDVAVVAPSYLLVSLPMSTGGVLLSLLPPSPPATRTARVSGTAPAILGFNHTRRSRPYRKLKGRTIVRTAVSAALGSICESSARSQPSELLIGQFVKLLTNFLVELTAHCYRSP